VRVISEKALKDFAQQHPDADAPLRAWCKLVKSGIYRNLAELKRTFGSVDYVSTGKGDFYVFNIAGNKYRLIAAIHFNRQMLFIRFILTHAEYDRGGWKK
jgi:mRNA interferase HigB